MRGPIHCRTTWTTCETRSVTGGHQETLVRYLLRQGDRALVLSQRLTQWLTRSHELEQEMAMGNLALDLLGQTRVLYAYAGEVEGRGRTEDDFAYHREASDFANPLLVEQEHSDFAWAMARQYLHDAWALPYWQAMASSEDETLAALAAKAQRETAYHLRHARSWILRLGDGTEESHRRCQDALDGLWPFTGELFEADEVELALMAQRIAADPEALRAPWRAEVESTLQQATLTEPSPSAVPQRGGRNGSHGPELAALLEELQEVARAHPGASW